MTNVVSHPTLLDWDSNFFGFTIGRLPSSAVTAEGMLAADHWASINQARCMYCLVDANANAQIQMLERNGYRFADIRLTFSRPASLPIANANGNYNLAAVLPHVEQNTPKLEDIAGYAFDRTRFFFDTNFPIDKARDLYRLWIKKGCLDQNTQVFVYSEEETPLGFISCTQTVGRTGSIGLIGVSAAAQRRGVGKALTHSALQWFQQQDLQQVEVVTQGSNIGAQRLYQHFGFKTQALQLWYHKWY